jgi:hypothetical protein
MSLRIEMKLTYLYLYLYIESNMSKYAYERIYVVPLINYTETYFRFWMLRIYILKSILSFTCIWKCRMTLQLNFQNPHKITNFPTLYPLDIHVLNEIEKFVYKSRSKHFIPWC